MKVDLKLSAHEAAQPEVHEVAHRAVLAALKEAGAKAPPRGGETEIVGDMATRATQRYTAMLQDMFQDLAAHT